ncbi:MAG: ABC transporter ATP-binding protein [Hyphomicrobiales bacterium]|jgi:branched-chain amino acid transport system ATP-binding protein
MKAVLEARGLDKRFGGVHAVRNVDIDVASGEILGLFGPNGAGKTTLFNIVAGMLRPDAGTIRLHGEDVTKLPAWRRARRGIGRTFQVTRPFRALSVLENVLAGVPRDGSTRPHDAASVRSLLTKVGLGDRADEEAGRLTLGMLKRLEVARALALEPTLLLLDEPLAGLTGREAADLLGFVVTLKARTAIIMVEHNVRQSLPVCDRALVLDAGALIASGTPEEIRSDPKVVRAYLGDEGAEPC